MTNKKPQGAFYERAPNILIKQIAELSAFLMNYPSSGHSKEVLKVKPCMLKHTCQSVTPMV